MGDVPLLAALARGGEHEVLRMSGRALAANEVLGAAAAAREDFDSARRIAVWMTPTLEAVVGVVAGLLAGLEVVPLNPAAGASELAHVTRDSQPQLLLHGAGEAVPALGIRRSLAVDVARRGRAWPGVPRDAESTALVLYTSGTTGPPKGVLVPRRAIVSNLDALAQAWEWTPADTVVHALPLFHAHGLVLGILGPLHIGGRAHHVGKFSPGAVGAALSSGGTMLFAVPTMYHRLGAAAATDPDLAQALARARLLVSGSAPLAVSDHRRIEELTGQAIVERYGLTESLMSCAVRSRGSRRPGYVGAPLDGVEVGLLDEAGAVITARGPGHLGEILVRGPGLFTGYLNDPAATAAAMRGDWLLTGDIGIQEADGFVRVLGRKNVDLVKTGGYRVGAGEVEAALMEHPAVAEAAVRGEPDADLGQRLVAWVVLEPGFSVDAGELIDQVAAAIGRHKRPRQVVFLPELPRNALGKVQKGRLAPVPPGSRDPGMR